MAAARLMRGPGRAAVVQAGAVAALAALLLWLAHNAARNMTARNMTFGFDFLLRPAGFDIPFHLLPWALTDTYGYALLVTFANTLLVAGLSIAAASALGLLLALMRLSGNPLAAGTSRGAMELIRNTPQLVQIIFIYFVVLQSLPGLRASLDLGAGFSLNVRGLFIPTPVEGGWPALAAGAALAAGVAALCRRRRWPVVLPALAVLLAGIAVAAATARWEVPVLRGFNFTGGARLPPELLALWLGISIYTSAFISEVVRAAILAIPRGQSEAALSLGLSKGRVMSLVVLPQALRIMLPPLTSQYLNIIKSTTLGAAIAYPEMLQIFGRTVLNQSGRAIEVMTILLSVFLAINLVASALMNRWNRRLALQGR